MRYGAHEVVRGIDLSVSPGTIFALLGPNGAGKTSTIEIIEGYRVRTSGQVEVLGQDPARGGRGFRERIGIMLQDGGIEPYLTVAEVLDATRGYYRRPRHRDELLEAVALTDQATTRVRRLSAGQRRRLELALAVCGSPEVLFLDEPTLGFDPVARRAAWRWIKDLADEGTTVLLTTNLMDEAQALADELAILVDGVVVAKGTPAEVVDERASTTLISFRLAVPAPTLPDGLLGAASMADGGGVELRTKEPTRTLRELTGWSLGQGIDLHDLTVRPRSLEEAYLDLVARART
jgi:ABC-2 type transport system ATP-binding protein